MFECIKDGSSTDIQIIDNGRVIMAGEKGHSIKWTCNYYTEDGNPGGEIENNESVGAFDKTDVFNNAKVKIFIPKNELDTEDYMLKKFKGVCVQLQAAVVNDWNSVKSFIDNKGLNAFNGTQIQSNRYEILLNFDFNLVKKDWMWKMFQTLTKFTDQQGSFMLEYVEYLSRSYLGMKKDEWTLSTPSLIITDSQEDQTPHLDVINPRTHRQFGLIITEDVVSTKVYEPNKDDSLNLIEALKLLKDTPAKTRKSIGPHHPLSSWENCYPSARNIVSTSKKLLKSLGMVLGNYFG